MTVNSVDVVSIFEVGYVQQHPGKENLNQVIFMLQLKKLTSRRSNGELRQTIK